MNATVRTDNQVKLPSGLNAVTVEVPEHDVRVVLDLDFAQLEAAFGQPDSVSVDLLLIAGAVYLLDRSIPRRLASDAWTRTFAVTIPVSTPNRWQMVRWDIEQTLCFLTGDRWLFDFIDQPSAPFVLEVRSGRKPRRVTANLVSLFSGGLDSLAGAIDVLVDSNCSPLLVGHHDATAPAGDQARLQAAINAIPAYRERTDLRRIRLRSLPTKLDPTRRLVRSPWSESTQRSRSFVFLALGLYAARALGADVPLLVPENGFIAVNMPLTPSRIGTCSTRTTHPYFMKRFADVARGVGLPNPISNPYRHRTKGEVLLDCADRKTLDTIAQQSVSCAHATRRVQWRRRWVSNCGYCFPCLIRRSALHVIGRDIGEDYGIDIGRREMDLCSPIGSDLRAVLDCLHEAQDSKWIANRLLEEGGLDLNERMGCAQTVQRGLQELRSFISAKGTDEMRAWAGIR